MNRVLEVGYALKLSGKEFIIKDIVGKGASSVTYLAEHSKTEHILKECNPLGIGMHRNETGELVADTELSRQKFEECLEKFKAGADKQLSFRLTEDLKNPTSNVQDIYHANGTAYIDMTYFGGKTYDKLDSETLYDLFCRMKALAQIVGHYHKLGYLHLDIKPQNIYTIPETPEMVMMFDFDSVTPMNDVNAIVSSSYTDVWAAPEQKMSKYRNQICETTDLFAIGEIIFFRIFGKHSEESDRYSFSQYEYLPENKWFENVNPRVLPMITELLHKTLSCSAKKRYQKAEELVEQLDKIIEFSNPKEPFLKSSLPNVSGFFTGRDTEIEEIHKRLQENNVLFLSGIGGIGKSELAKHYAEAYKDSYDVIVFAPFLHDIQTMMTNDSYVQIHNFFQYPEEKPNEYFERKMRELAKLCDERILIIVDNFDTTEDENLSRLLKLNCKMLITTRRDFTEPYPDFQLDLGTLTNPVEVFNEHYKKLLSDDERKCVDEIIEIVDGHTMTIELLAKQMMAGRVKPEKMLEKLKSGGISESGKEKVSHANEKGDISRENTYDHIQALFDLSDLAEDEKYILANLSLIPHTGIPAELFKEWCEIEDFNTINNLAIEGWIRWDKEKDYISVHPVVGDISFRLVKHKPEYCETMLKKAVQSSSDDVAFSNTGVQSSAEYATLCMLFSQKVIRSGLSCESMICFLNGIPSVFWRFGYTNEAAFCREQALNICRTILGEKHEQTAMSCRELGAIYLEQSLFEKAEECLSTALDIQHSIYSNDNAEVANTLYCLGHLYLEQNRFQRAEKCYMDALKTYTAAYGRINTKISNIYNDLGMLFWLKSDFEMAKKHYLEALSIGKQASGEMCSDVATSYGNLGILHHDYGFLDEAEKFYMLSYDICIALYGEQHKLTANVINSLGDLYRNQNNYEKAEFFLVKALHFYQTSYGEYHDETANSYNNIGALYRDQKNYPEAEKNYSRALLIWRQIHGEKHTYTAIAYGNLAAVYRDLGLLDIAESHAIKALKIRTDLYGENHLDTALSHYGLGLLYEKKKDIITAKEYYQKAFEIRLKLLGSNHTETTNAKTKIAHMDAIMCGKADD